jgi:hypothetical protein
MSRYHSLLLVSLLASLAACAMAPPAAPRASLGCFAWTHGPWPPTVTESSGLWIPPPPLVELTSEQIDVRGESKWLVRPAVLTGYGQEVETFWEPRRHTDSLRVTWRIGDYGTELVLRRRDADHYVGYVQSFTHVAGAALPRASAVATRAPCGTLSTYISTHAT